MDSKVRLVPAQFRHINRIANNLREIDGIECRSTGRTPKDALREAFFSSKQAWTALVDGRPEAMFGVVVTSVLTGEGVPWFLGTEEVYRHGRELIMWGPGIIERLHNSRLRLANVVCSRNEQAIKLLRKWGFTVSEDEIEMGGEMFHLFEKEPV